MTTRLIQPKHNTLSYDDKNFCHSLTRLLGRKERVCTSVEGHAT
ncbi:hypothetical protein CSUI_005880, partial [Cystoisospora suis]